ncbi:hypothetical protein [Celeribacter marinus]|uniref:Uncharacterized protein n=1 Tax=Celeribacter marinus TaxID=1397108 RepID=A0A0N9ZZ53_9RHOB|nr:hypothetical protein [Celeribacter marinus]ALI55586.1 hypothetical protein IMCC12053_1639 [Celeribacter marinus]SFK23096.1 hypothetical protein SAMN05444421_102190 [Celeribacter marinus]
MELRVSIDDGGNPRVLFPIHFEVPDHLIEFSTLQKCSRGVLDVFSGIGVGFPDAAVEFDVVLAPLEEGGVTAWIGKKAHVGTYFLLGALAGPFADGFIEEATGREVRDWGALAYNEAGKLLVDFSQELVDGVREKMIEAELCRTLLEVNHDRFEELISERPEMAREILNGRRKFYEACKSNKRLPSIQLGVLPETRRIIRREFPDRMVRDHIDSTKTQKTIERGEWKSAILSLEITSPNWERLDQQRGWKGKLKDGKYVYFEISDTRFWQMFEEKSLDADTPDHMTAQFLYRDVNGRFKAAEAIAVFSFNGKNVSKPTSQSKVDQRIAERNAVQAQRQDGLFRET